MNAQQSLNLVRVSDKIASLILEFCSVNAEFHMVDLCAYVTAREPSTAPDSPSRILRSLRRQGLVDYQVVSRSASLYRMVQA